MEGMEGGREGRRKERSKGGMEEGGKEGKEKSLGILGALKCSRKVQPLVGLRWVDGLKLEEETELWGSLLGIQWKVRDDGRIWKHSESLVKFACQCHQLINRNPQN